MVSGVVCNSARSLCNSVAPVSAPSKAVLGLMNTGSKASSFMVTFDSCNHPVVAVAEQSINLAAGASTDVVFEVCNMGFH